MSPRGAERDTAAYELLDGIEIHRFSVDADGVGGLAYAREYAIALWRIWRLVRSLARERRFDVVHACNPPDILLLAALPLKRHGTRFVFDHHDLSPELYLSKFAGKRDVVYWTLRALERLSFWLADVVISTNESYRRIAITRGRKPPDDVFVVRNAPDLDRFKSTSTDETLKRGRRHLLAYAGIMGRQDGVDHAIRALTLLKRKRQDWHAVFAGDGSELTSMRSLARELGVDDHIDFTGLLEDPDLVMLLATADVCLAPEPKNPLNDASTMVKIGEYMALGKPVVSYDLVEARATAAEAAAYAEANDEASFAERISELLDDSHLRARMGASGHERVTQGLSWQHSEKHLLAAYERTLGSRPARPSKQTP